MQTISPEITQCEDGSSTLLHPIIKENYHSLRGAYGESLHIYIRNGMDRIKNDHISILEIGLGSGLNALLTLQEAASKEITVNYTAIELYPVSEDVIERLQYDKYCDKESYELFKLLHHSVWNKKIALAPFFTINKINAPIESVKLEEPFDLVYFDAFSPEIQPELWSVDIFKKIYSAMNINGILVTYSAKGLVKENLREAGFHVKRLKGALGKHHMVLATRL